MKLDDAAKQWFSSPAFAGLSPRTRQIYKLYYDKLTEFHGKQIHTITRPMVVEWRDRNYHKPSVCRMSVMTLSSLFRFAVDYGLVTGNPVIGIRGMPQPKEIERWDESHVRDFIERSPEPLAAAVALAFYSGQRISDLVSMQWTAISDKYIYVSQKKTSRKLHIPIHRGLLPYLDGRRAAQKKLRRKTPYVLTNAYGKNWTTQSLTKAVSRQNAILGYPGKQFHGIRKTTASLLAEMGCTPSQIMAITGHSTLREVTRYTAEAEQRLLAVSAMEKMK